MNTWCTKNVPRNATVIQTHANAEYDREDIGVAISHIRWEICGSGSFWCFIRASIDSPTAKVGAKSRQR